MLTIVVAVAITAAAFPWPNPARRDLAMQCIVVTPPAAAPDGLRGRLDFILRQGGPATEPCLAYDALQKERLLVGIGGYLGLAAGLLFLALGSILKRLRIRATAMDE